MAGAPCDRRRPATQEMRREHETALSRLAATERRVRGEAAPSDGGVASGRGADEESELRTLLLQAQFMRETGLAVLARELLGSPAARAARAAPKVSAIATPGATAGGSATEGGSAREGDSAREGGSASGEHSPSSTSSEGPGSEVAPLEPGEDESTTSQGESLDGDPDAGAAAEGVGGRASPELETPARGESARGLKSRERKGSPQPGGKKEGTPERGLNRTRSELLSRCEPASVGSASTPNLLSLDRPEPLSVFSCFGDTAAAAADFCDAVASASGAPSPELLWPGAASAPQGPSAAAAAGGSLPRPRELREPRPTTLMAAEGALPFEYLITDGQSIGLASGWSSPWGCQGSSTGASKPRLSRGQARPPQRSRLPALALHPNSRPRPPRPSLRRTYARPCWRRRDERLARRPKASPPSTIIRRQCRGQHHRNPLRTVRDSAS